MTPQTQMVVAGMLALISVATFLANAASAQGWSPYGGKSAGCGTAIASGIAAIIGIIWLLIVLIFHSSISFTVR